jgi:Ca2+-binding RTX toxin-like protein
MVGLEGADTFVGDTGVDTVDYSDSPAAPVSGFPGFDGVVADLRAAGGSIGSTGGHAEGDTYLANDVEGVIGTPFHDYIIGNLLNNVLDGLGGDDTIVGNQGDDDLLGGSGNDTLIGSDGAVFTDFDRFDGGAGDDRIYADAADLIGSAPAKILGGAGAADILDFVFSGGVTFLNDFGAGATTGGFEQIYGSSGNDQITTTGTQAPNVYYVGFAGNDLLQGGSGNDTLNGDAGNDALTGGDGADVFIGGDGDDLASDFDVGEGDVAFGMP